MRPDDPDEFAGSDDFGFLPELWEMPRIARNQVVCARGIGAFDKNVIGRVGRDWRQAGWRNGMGSVLEQLKKLVPQPLANLKFCPRQHDSVLPQDRGRHVQAGRLAERQEQYRALQACRLERGRYHDIGVQD